MQGEGSSGDVSPQGRDAFIPTVLAVEALPPGTLVGPWTVLRRLAAGGYGTVYVARRSDRVRAPWAALKLARQSDTPWFSREAEILSRLRHPAVPRLLATGAWRLGDGSHPFLVMEYVEGESLYAWSRARNPTARDVGALLAQAAEALAFAHQRGVLHRDFKGDNIRIRPGGKLVLLDWGAGWHPEAVPLTGTGQLPPGTAHYYSPQLHLRRVRALSGQVLEGPSYSVADELYAVGVTFHRLLTETYPAPAMMEAGALPPRGPATSAVSRLNSRVPEALASLITRLLAFAPDARPPHALALASEVQRLLADAPLDWDVPLFDWACPPSPQSRTTQGDPRAAGPVAPGQEAALQHARRQRMDRLQGLRAARELRRRSPAQVAAMEARSIRAAAPWRREQVRRALWRRSATGALLLLAAVGLLWGLGTPRTRASEDAAPVSAPTARSASPSMARPSGSDQAAAPGAAPPSHAPLPQETSAMKVSPTKQAPGSLSRTLARRCTLAVGAGATLLSCAGAPLVPKPQCCPQEALEAMKALNLERDGKATITLDARHPWSLDAETLTVSDGDIISVQEEGYGRLPEGTLLYGHLWTGGERVVGRYTRARTPDGRTYPVCIILGNPEGWWKEKGSKPGAAIVDRRVGYTVVDAFP
ncbi:serine/threonine-protein kinase [Corallococcus sp. Z5C101001]|uniref:serine/threonine protein kinase n=1 Tax=Corallococcus sp. Z5C101001 TaxID=2596829 RepID=UPI00118035B4|nr:serine/threonine-protein kinase [Corallococcus sp. Z5C101001]TSC29548.1 serine/threonine protein kinase [Corallococcus sp. Z5C101001]